MLAHENDFGRLIVTLVHGTWGQGLFRKSRKGAPRWFEPDSDFQARLRASFERENIGVVIAPFLWSGSNSLKARDDAGKGLAAQLIQQDADNPGSRQLIIAHSHGGNVAIRAVDH